MKTSTVPVDANQLKPIIHAVVEDPATDDLVRRWFQGFLSDKAIFYASTNDNPASTPDAKSGSRRMQKARPK